MPHNDIYNDLSPYFTTIIKFKNIANCYSNYIEIVSILRGEMDEKHQMNQLPECAFQNLSESSSQHDPVFKAGGSGSSQSTDPHLPSGCLRESEHSSAAP